MKTRAFFISLEIIQGGLVAKLSIKERNLKDLVDKWSEILRIQDWIITIHLCTPERFFYLLDQAPDDTVGSVRIFSKHKNADVFLRECEGTELEATLLHELLHIAMDEFDTVVRWSIEGNPIDDTRQLLEEMRSEALERAVNCMKTALLNADRG